MTCTKSYPVISGHPRRTMHRLLAVSTDVQFRNSRRAL